MIALGTNIRHLRKQEGYTQEQLAKKIGVKRPLIGAYEEGRVEPKLATIINMSRLFKVSLDDLICKDLSSDSTSTVQKVYFSGRQLRVLPIAVDANENERSSLVSVKASAGYTNGYGDVEYIENLPSFSMPFPEIPNDKTIRVFQIQGESMLPVMPGAYIVSEYLQDWSNVRNDECYVLVTKEEGIVYKRVLNNMKEGVFTLKSDNTEYSPYNVKVNEVLEIWKALGTVSFVLPDLAHQPMNIKELASAFREMKKDIADIKSRI